MNVWIAELFSEIGDLKLNLSAALDIISVWPRAHLKALSAYD